MHKSTCVDAKIVHGKRDDQDVLKCWNLEQLLEAATFGQPKPTELTMSGLTSEVECEEQEPQQQTNVGNLKDDCIELAKLQLS